MQTHGSLRFKSDQGRKKKWAFLSRLRIDAPRFALALRPTPTPTRAREVTEPWTIRCTRRWQPREPPARGSGSFSAARRQRCGDTEVAMGLHSFATIDHDTHNAGLPSDYAECDNAMARLSSRLALVRGSMWGRPGVQVRGGHRLIDARLTTRCCRCESAWHLRCKSWRGWRRTQWSRTEP